MMRLLRDLRFIPIAVVACTCLLALKAADVLLGDGSGDSAPTGDESVIRTTADVPRPATSMLSWASQMFNFPDGSGATATSQVVESFPADRSNGDITGSVTEQPATHEAIADKGDTPIKTAPAAQTGADTKPPGTVIPVDAAPSGAERAILERLQERRQELDTRARELDIRESLIQAAEKRMEGQLAELKETEANIKVETQQKDDAQAARFKGLVTMYENMKPRDAAKIFDRLELGVLMQVASKIDPRHMADILAQMSPDTAERLTVELASQAQQVKPGAGPADLPKIEGQPTTP
ncbi:MAG TPA: flagellar protein FlbB [Xanthobacteraceae bacterium]|nr:flagellar protein FlbB [Xanthobacteraceae bacterium]